MGKKIVWALVSIEIEGDELDDEAAMDWVDQDLHEQGYVIDDIGIRNNEEDKA